MLNLDTPLHIFWGYSVDDVSYMNKTHWGIFGAAAPLPCQHEIMECDYCSITRKKSDKLVEQLRVALQSPVTIINNEIA